VVVNDDGKRCVLLSKTNIAFVFDVVFGENEEDPRLQPRFSLNLKDVVPLKHPRVHLVGERDGDDEADSFLCVYSEYSGQLTVGRVGVGEAGLPKSPDSWRLKSSSLPTWKMNVAVDEKSQDLR
jgi:hypothetical protein